MPDPVSAACVSAIGSRFKLVDYAVRFSSVGTENQVFLSLISRVRADLLESERLLHHPPIAQRLIDLPDNKAWIQGAITDAKNALADIGRFVENVRIDVEKGTGVGPWHRLQWVLDHHAKLESREKWLQACHQSLIGALHTMHTWEAETVTEKAAVPEPSTTLVVITPAPTGPMETDQRSPPAYEAIRAWMDEEDEPLRSPSVRRPKSAGRQSEDTVMSLEIEAVPPLLSPNASSISSPNEICSPPLLQLKKSAYSPNANVLVRDVLGILERAQYIEQAAVSQPLKTAFQPETCSIVETEVEMDVKRSSQESFNRRRRARERYLNDVE